MSQYGIVWHDKDGMVWHGMVWNSMAWHGMAQYGMVWYGMVWHGMAQHGMVKLQNRTFGVNPVAGILPVLNGKESKISGYKNAWVLLFFFPS